MKDTTPKLPLIMYGTAWKEERTESLVTLALDAGFRAIDTANQRRHYFEAGVGDALAKAYDAGKLRREDLFLQTKFTFLGGQDQRLPYDPKADYRTQVQQSFQSSLEHLHTDYLDSYVLHGPSVHPGLAYADWEVWRTMEELQQSGKAKVLGISNVTLDQLKAICDEASVIPAFVQNRCYASSGWDKNVRSYCDKHQIIYQGFSLLTANAPILNLPEFRKLVARVARTPAQIIFRFAVQMGMFPLTGTTAPNHMREDLAISDFTLAQADINLIESIAAR